MEYLYHTTLLRNVESIVNNGLLLDMGSTIGSSSYDRHRSGKIFFSLTLEGVRRWLEVLSNTVDHNYDNLLEDLAIPVVLRIPFGEERDLKEDEVARGEGLDEGASYLSTDIVEEDIEIWDGANWTGIENWEGINYVSALEVIEDGEGGEDYYLDDSAALFSPR